MDFLGWDTQAVVNASSVGQQLCAFCYFRDYQIHPCCDASGHSGIRAKQAEPFGGGVEKQERPGFVNTPRFEVLLYHLLATQILAAPIASLSLGFLICNIAILNSHNVMVNFKLCHDLSNMLGTDPGT